MSIQLVNNNINDEDMWLADSAIAHTILKDQKYFSNLVMQEINVGTISSSSKLNEGSKRANLSLAGRTKFYINNALYSTKSQRNLLSFKDIRRNGYRIKTTNEGNIEYLYITSMISSTKCIPEQLPAFSSSFYYMYISIT